MLRGREPRLALHAGLRLLWGVLVSQPALWLSDEGLAPLDDEGLRHWLWRLERWRILSALRTHGDHLAKAAAALGIHRRTLYEKLAKMRREAENLRRERYHREHYRD